MTGVEYTVKYNGRNVTDSSAPLALLGLDLTSLRAQFYTEDRKHLDYTYLLYVQAVLRFGDVTVQLSDAMQSQLID